MNECRWEKQTIQAYLRCLAVNEGRDDERRMRQSQAEKCISSVHFADVKVYAGLDETV